MYTYYDRPSKAGWTPVLAFVGILMTYGIAAAWMSVHCPRFVWLATVGAVCAFMMLVFVLCRRKSAATEQLAIRVDDEGIYSSAWSDKPIPWSNITRAEIGVQDPQAVIYRCWLTLKALSLDPSRQELGWHSFFRNRRTRVCLIVPSAKELDRLVSAIGQRLPDGVKRPSSLSGTLIFLARIIQLLSLEVEHAVH